MKTLKTLLSLAPLAVFAAGCKYDTSPIIAPKPPIAFTRYVHAVPDSGGMDFRFVDVIENSPVTFAMNFRGTFPGSGYSETGAGSRHLRVFQSGNAADPTLNTPEIVSKVLFDTTFNFVANTHYTIMVAGNMRAGQGKLFILTDDFADPGNGVEVRVVNAGVGTVDVYTSSAGGSTALPSSALVAGLGSLSASKYVPTSTASAMFLRAVNAGTKTVPALVEAAMPAGLAADQPNDLTAVGGIAQPGSVITAFLMPKSVAGSKATSFTTAGIVYIVDKNPNSGF
ncbi:MAG TPA: DUF4397 domain-containing protein [Gemmatimonadaceae bacterium]|nr:DUF4397 domain-containing protein [Gemmatimonadaceae bacterium]